MTVEVNQKLIQWGKAAKKAARQLRRVTEHDKNQALLAIADALIERKQEVLDANQKDLEEGRANGLRDSLLERLTLNDSRIEGMAGGLRQIQALADPTLITDKGWINRDGLKISKRRVPLGVIGMIYESRPNVTVDASALCLKAGNAVILRGGKEALNSNQALINIIQDALATTNVPKEAVQLINDPSRELASQFMQLNQYVDCLIPRGGAGLIRAVLNQATVPVIETGVGNCHLYIHTDADVEKAKNILVNAKTQRNSVCNAIETLLIDEEIANSHLREFIDALADYDVEIRADEKGRALIAEAKAATDEDYHAEYLDMVLAVKVVKDYEEAVEHIEEYATGHSDAIVTENYSVAQDFMDDIDSAQVYVNASTRFSDGEVFGFGGEIGISTQKLHARGPLGLEALTTYKYTVEGQGQVRQ